jgi:hypothetical protein
LTSARMVRSGSFSFLIRFQSDFDDRCEPPLSG